MKHKYISLAKKALAVFLATLFVGTVCPTAFAAVETAEKNYIIDNPYEGIDWDSWGNYKTQLHCHTTASDGFLTIDEFCKMHYACDYDIVALTDDAFGFVVPFALKSSGTFVDVTTEVYNNPHFTGYENEAVNEIIETALNLTDKKSKDRAKLLMEAEKLIMADAPVAPLFFEKNNLMAAKSLSKFTVDYRGNAVFTEAKLKDYLEINEAKIAAEEAEEAAGTAK